MQLSILNQRKSRQVGGCKPAQRFIQLSASSREVKYVLFCEGNRREEVLEGCSADLMGMQVSPNSASDLALCVSNETDLKLV